MRSAAFEDLVWNVADAVCPQRSVTFRLPPVLPSVSAAETYQRSEIRDAVRKAVEKWAENWTEEVQAVSHVDPYAVMEYAGPEKLVEFRRRENEAMLRKIGSMIAEEGRARGVVSFVDHGLVHLGLGAARAYLTEMGIMLLRTHAK